MKIKTFAVKNFRGISGDKTAISFEKSEIIFLIGLNNTGKSSVLNAYQYLTQSGEVASINDFHCGNSDLPIEIEAWFTKEPGDDFSLLQSLYLHYHQAESIFDPLFRQI